MLYQKIVDLCSQCGISVSKLEKEANIGNGTIGRWRNSSPTIDSIKKVATYFGCTVDELISDVPQK